MAKWWKEFLASVAPVAGAAAGTFREAARETMREAQERVREVTRMVIKAMVVFLIVALGFIYVLNGLAKYLEAANGWAPGMGTIVVGGVMVVLGLFAVLIRR